MSSSPASDRGPISQKLETAQAVRHADGSDSYEMQEGVVSRKWQGTDADRKEMSQLGRVQELRVSFEEDKRIPFGHSSWDIILTVLTAKLPIHLDGRLCVYLDRDMGGASHDSREHPDEWRNCGRDLGIPHCLRWVPFRVSLDR